MLFSFLSFLFKAFSTVFFDPEQAPSGDTPSCIG